MKKSIIRFSSSLGFLVALAGVISITDQEGWLSAWLILFIFVGIPVLILSWIDLGRSLRSIKKPTIFINILSIIFGVPQALFGMISIIIGVSLVIWVLYNTFIETQPEYTGGILTFGVAPGLILFGVYWLRVAFTREEREGEAE